MMTEPRKNHEKNWEEVPIRAKMSVEHEEWPGYRVPFYVTVAAGALYLVLILAGVITG